MRRYAIATFTLTLTLWALAASAHPLKPGLLRIDPGSAADGTFEVMLKLPGTGNRAAPVKVRFPAGCEKTGDPRTQVTSDAVLQRWRMRCAPGALTSAPLVFEALSRKVGEVLVLYPTEDGGTQSAVARAEHPTVTLVSHGAPLLTSYLGLGVEHILLGIDHLLFVLGLIMLVFGQHSRGNPATTLLWTITAFTVAHSLTLGAATLGWVSVPSDAVETIIALSIVLLAMELARPANQAQPSWTASHPASVAFAFGLLHGFGFAGALTDLGVPEDNITGALLLFNVGVELGQLAFVLIVGLLWRVVKTAPTQALQLGHTAIVHALGGLAFYWCLDRGSALVERLLSS